MPPGYDVGKHRRLPTDRSRRDPGTHGGHTGTSRRYRAGPTGAGARRGRDGNGGGLRRGPAGPCDQRADARRRDRCAGGPAPARVDRRGPAVGHQEVPALGVVLLGLQLGLGQVLGLGGGTVLAVAATVLVAFFGTLLVGRALGVSPGLGLMVATGFSICGASAIAAMDSVTDNDKRDVATAVTLVTLYGSAAIGLVPLLGALLGLRPEQLGAWAGVSVHEVAQVVA